GEPTGSPSHDAERHRRPSYVNRPAVWNGQFDDGCHEQKSRRCKPCSKAKNEEDGKDDFRTSRQKRHGCGSWIRIGSTRQVQHEFAGKQIYRRIVEGEKAIPFENPGPPEWHRETKAQDKLDQRGLRDETDHPG